jgi:hypothetical protein
MKVTFDTKDEHETMKHFDEFAASGTLRSFPSSEDNLFSHTSDSNSFPYKEHYKTSLMQDQL